MRMHYPTLALCGAICLGAPASGQSVAQTFNNQWTVSAWDYYGYVSAREWQYQPYVTAVDGLSAVTIDMRIFVTGMVIGDTFRYRSSFVTGSAPAAYQFYTEEYVPDVSGAVNLHRTWRFENPDQLQAWVNPQYGPGGVHYFESESYEGSHTVTASTTLTYEYNTVPEPGTLMLLATGLLALAFSVTRKAISV